jgi:isocitrate dehydrogenase
MSEKEKSEKEWLRQYDALAERFNKVFQDAKERSREAMHAALDKAKDELVAAKEFSAERGEELRRYLAQDLEQTLDAARHLGEAARQRLDPARLEAGALASLAGVLERAGKAMLDLGRKAKSSLTCKTGEITSAGTLTCQACGEQLHFGRTARIPPCPKCNGTVFTKSY